MTSRRFFAPFLSVLLLAAFAVAAACGGGDDDDGDGGLTGQISDPNNVPTSTPWGQAPEVVILDPENLGSLPPDGGGNGSQASATPLVGGEPGVCGDTYTVEAGDITVNIAEQCGVSVEAIEAANPDVDVRSLSIGQVLVMPAPEPEDELDPEEVVPEAEGEAEPEPEPEAAEEDVVEPEEVTPEATP